MPLLKISPDARSTALGETGVAGAAGSMAAFHNPALLTFAKSSEATFGYSDWILDLTIQTGALLFKSGKTALGISFNAFTVPDLELRTLPSDDPLQTFSAHDVTAGFSIAHLFGEKLALGGTARYLSQQIYIENSSGFSVDLGAVYRLSINDLKVGVVLMNLGSMSALDEENTTLPTYGAAGVSGRIIRSDDFGLRSSADLRLYLENDVRLHAGLEGSWKEHLFLRAGYQTGSELRSFSGGMGFGWKGYRFDYAYQPLAEDFGASHRFAISISF
ncbi:hypothetical protein CEE37_04430 [candidate division LCP-89 bacterium B3_LCP]|uniref:Type IX secretion system protein PorV domain-containing protein n=1 Tax=candidate division LCP-89 bacterium B3_LCP TaxID=2012998 RepID=A0A532V3M8_UNCL8|nr:MAG: hypothetical protein CEE37_04430 [candidate division LCP-89 bacterium B3_LCP]